MKKFYLVIASIGVGLVFPNDMKLIVVVFLCGMLMAGLYFERDKFFGFREKTKSDGQSTGGTDETITK